MTEPIHVRRFIVGASPDEVIDWDNDPRVQVRPVPVVKRQWGIHNDGDPAEWVTWWEDRDTIRALIANGFARRAGHLVGREVTEWQHEDWSALDD